MKKNAKKLKIGKITLRNLNGGEGTIGYTTEGGYTDCAYGCYTWTQRWCEYD